MPEPVSIVSLIAAMLLAASAGLNPYLPLMIVAVMAYSGNLTLPPPFGFVGRIWFVILAALLFLVNVFLDKAFLPGDSLATPVAQRSRRAWAGVAHDLGQMLLGPLAGAVLMWAISGFLPQTWPLVAPMLGILLAALVYTGKRALRRRLAGRLGPFTNLLMSAIEDVAVVMLCVAGLLLLRSQGV